MRLGIFVIYHFRVHCKFSCHVFGLAVFYVHYSPSVLLVVSCLMPKLTYIYKKNPKCNKCLSFSCLCGKEMKILIGPTALNPLHHYSGFHSKDTRKAFRIQWWLHKSVPFLLFRFILDEMHFRNAKNTKY